MASETRNHRQQQHHPQQRTQSLFDLPRDFFELCTLSHGGPSLSSSSSSRTQPVEPHRIDAIEEEFVEVEEKGKKAFSRWSCNTCKSEFESLEDQRSHFKSDLHRFNVKLSIAGKAVIREEEFDESVSDSIFDNDDISSISGSEDEMEKGNEVHKKAGDSAKQKIYISLQTGEVVSLWRNLFLSESETLSYDNNDKLFSKESSGSTTKVGSTDLVRRLKDLITEPRDKTQLRILLLASGGHFAGCVFDGNSVVAHKTFHRYVVRAKSGKKQSSKDATGRAANSAGASLRRYNELALKKEIHDLLSSWKPYFDASSCVFVYAPSNNRQLLFNGEEPYFSHTHCLVRHVPFTVRRPTFKEAKRIYNFLTNLTYEIVEEHSPSLKNESTSNGTEDGNLGSNEQLADSLDCKEVTVERQIVESLNALSTSDESNVLGTWTPIHEAAMSNNAQWTLELLEQGLDPCIKDERGRTPYMLATEKEVRSTFRRFMASNPDKWDWQAAKVPSALTKELEESQAAKQAEKDAKKKARAKELRKVRRAKEKNAQAEAAVPQTAPVISQSPGFNQVPVLRQHSQSSSGGSQLSKEEELKRAREAEREKRAAAAEKRIAAAAALNAQTPSSTPPSNSQQPLKGAASSDTTCSCCNVSLAGKVPFHRPTTFLVTPPFMLNISTFSTSPPAFQPFDQHHLTSSNSTNLTREKYRITAHRLLCCFSVASDSVFPAVKFDLDLHSSRDMTRVRNDVSTLETLQSLNPVWNLVVVNT
ncbi:hypothetical protein Sjap_020775 [Stephania japonica]|uniref:VLRF1 domain-containing protein n=1 Tax=Stephania japonica TaxID=461633 RepID=A0AAP0F1C1_9MAGN